VLTPGASLSRPRPSRRASHLCTMAAGVEATGSTVLSGATSTAYEALATRVGHHSAPFSYVLCPEP